MVRRHQPKASLIDPRVMYQDDDDEEEDYIDKLLTTLQRDDPESFTKLVGENPMQMTDSFRQSAQARAKKCLTAFISGNLWDDLNDSRAKGTYYSSATPLALVCAYFPDPDVINLMLVRGAVQDVNTKCSVALIKDGLPIDHAFHPVLHCVQPWSVGASVFKLVILLCQWRMKPHLESPRLLARYTDSLNEVAWSFVETGRLVQFAALLLIAKEKVMVPFDTGMTIQQHAKGMIDVLSSEGDLYSDYKSMLEDACKLVEVFDRAGDALSSYCSSMNKCVPPEDVLVDIACVLKKAGFLLQPADLDLRDSYRGRLQLCKTNLFKLSDLPSPDPYFTRAQVSNPPLNKPFGHWDLLRRLNSGTMLNLASSAGPSPRLFSTATSHQAGSSIPLKHLAYAAVKLKRGMKIL